ncbi:helix-turn-helix domain-containing protein [Ensifer sp. PDNC004]|nr:helix-turn-helix domain-containing protein [Ensifer sp. PDNC004]
MVDITPKERLAALFIGSFMTPSVPFCFASMDYICRHTGCERTTVHRVVIELEKRGFMLVDRAKRGGNVYRIAMPY